MMGIGTIINCIAIIIGGVIGLLFGKLINDSMANTLTKAMGLCVIFIAINDAVKNSLTNGNATMMVICFIIGSIIGELLQLSTHLENFGEWLKKKTHSEKDDLFIEGFVNASMTVCIGAMAVMGAIQDGIFHNPDILIVKALLDFIIIVVMSATLKKGCLFSFIPVLIFQGTITILSGLIANYLTDLALAYLSICGSMLIFCVGVNLVKPKTFNVVNMLPTLLFCVIYALI